MQKDIIYRLIRIIGLKDDKKNLVRVLTIWCWRKSPPVRGKNYGISIFMAKPSQRIFWDLCSVSFVLCSISFVLCSLSFVLCFVSLVLFSVSMASTDGVQWTLFSLIASCHPLLHCWSKHLHAGSKFYLWGICNWASCHCRVEKCIVERAPFIKTQKKCLETCSI